IVDRARAGQPMGTDGDRWVVFNGEIYNHARLREELAARGYRFTTESDTEVLLHGYAEWGNDLPRHLDGIFAFLVYDGRRERYLYARDPMGVKPLYHGSREGRLYVASELKCLSALGIDGRALPPGHLAHHEEEARYFSLSAEPVEGEDGELVARFRHLLETAVLKRVQTDLPVGVIFSGGIDSAAVLALARRHHPRVAAFSVGLEGAPDLDYARRYCAEEGIPHHVRELRLDELAARVSQLVYRVETFETVDLMDASVMAPAFELAHDHGFKVVLCGDGSDELLAGYDLFRRHPDPVALMTYRVGNLHRTDLQRVDRAAMMHTVEARVPFMDRELVRFAYRLPLRVKLRDGIEKWILRAATDDVLPRYLAWRPKIRMPEGTGLRYQLLDRVRTRASRVDADTLERLGVQQSDVAYFLEQYLEHGFPMPAERYKRPGWDFEESGYFTFAHAGS
ncbi:MAG TPA: asparagine synthase-related protein, partial [Candidatus Eisenbacteria bacterium]|nr:asparagine synthase-related protein [Candidatus Eisenbacteria bacterium]